MLGKAMDASAKYNFDSARIDADDALQETDKSFLDGTVTIGVYGMTLATRAILMGHSASSPNDGLTGNVADVAPFVGIGYYGKSTNGWTAIFYTKVQFGDPADEFATRKDRTEFKTPTLEGALMKDDDGDWIAIEEFALEADAIAWLNAKVGISSTPSAGLSALAVTGTGGTISPAFGAAVRYYTFGGLTGVNFTVTPTAAGHTIKMYVNDDYVQDIISGSASAAVAMSAIGTKKVKLVAYESGKASQTTEIVVVKTA